MIKKIILKKVASFDESGIELDNLTKINVIYGGNGTGKTTIGRFLSNSDDSDFADSNIEWEEGDRERIIVYNKIFRDKNILRTDKIAGIYTLGDGNAEAVRRIEELRNQLDTVIHQREGFAKTLREKHDDLNNLEERLRDDLWNMVYHENEDFDQALQGFKHKNNFKDKVLQIYRRVTDVQTEYQKDDLLHDYNTFFAQGTLSEIETLSMMPNADLMEQIESDDIWMKVVAGKEDIGLGQLIAKLGMSDWVYAGKAYLELSGDICPFCQRPTITTDFRHQLENYYDETFRRDLNTIREMEGRFNTWQNDFTQWENTIKSKAALLSTTMMNMEELNAALVQMENLLTTNQRLIAGKIKEPSRQFQLDPIHDKVAAICRIVNRTNDDISSYNNSLLHLKDERKALQDKICQYLVKCATPYLLKFDTDSANENKAISQLNDQLEQKKKNCIQLETTMREQESRLTNVSKSVERINGMLKSFGFLNFKLRVMTDDDTKYEIVRPEGNAVGETLSEGEETFISFLYFMQLFEGGTGKDEVMDRRIVVIDDPVSSLDSNVLYVVSSLLKEMFKRVRSARNDRTTITQVILLTHNVYFHKEVTYIDSQFNNFMRFWVLRKHEQFSRIKAWETKNPIRDSYQLLWDELKNVKEQLDDGDNSYLCLTVQNIMRRILEWYFKILGNKSRDDQVLEGFVDTEEREIARSMLVWANEGSHCVPDDAYVGQPYDLTQKYFSVFKTIFERVNQEQHYKMMMGENFEE